MPWRQLANHLASLGAKLNYANPSELDIDSTIQEANMAYPSNAGLLVKLACIAKRLVDPIDHLKESVTEKISVHLKEIKEQGLYHFNLKRQNKHVLSQEVLKSLWQRVMKEVLPVIRGSARLEEVLKDKRHWNIKKSIRSAERRLPVFIGPF